jgi:chloramphenicol 3-O-phosphotransferase
VFVVVINGAAGAGKSVCLMALSDMLVVDELAHAVIDVDEVAWAFPYPSNEERFELASAAAEAHRRLGKELLLVAEVVESAGELGQLLAAVGADEHLLVLLRAPLETLRQRIVEREPPGWSGLDYLLGETERWAVALEELEGVHLALDTEALTPDEAAGRIRAERPDVLGG